MEYSLERSIEEESSEQIEMTSSKRASCSLGERRGAVVLVVAVGDAAEELDVDVDTGALEVAVEVEGVALLEEVRKMFEASCSASLSFLSFSYSGSSVSTSNLHIGHWLLVLNHCAMQSS